MKQTIECIESFRPFSGEPNRRKDLAAFGLVRSGRHPDVRTATITMAGQQREIRVTPITTGGIGENEVTILRPTKVDFRQAVRELTGDRSLRSLQMRRKSRGR